MDQTYSPKQAFVHKFAIATLLFNLGIILGGAMVRATGSGAGCGKNWPLCDGVIVPGFKSLHQMIEFGHRSMVGVGIIVVFLLWLATARAFPKHHPARKAAFWSGIFTFTESLVGASIVLMRWVAADKSVQRAFADSAHLVNTLTLIGTLSLCIWWSANRAICRVSFKGKIGWILATALVLVSLVGATGALTALADTLFPPGSTSEIGQSVSISAHYLKKVRVIHPMMATLTGIMCFLTAAAAVSARPSDQVKNLAFGVSAFVVFQVCLGFANLFLLAPLPLQLAHLLVADGLWITLIFLVVATLSVAAEPRLASSNPAANHPHFQGGLP